MNQQIVNLRGIAILLVMLGHSIIIYDNSFALLSSDVQMPFFESLKHVISFVQMKLFISISGFLLAYKCLRRTKFEWRFYKDKMIRLLVPYLFVCLFFNDPIKYFLGVPGYENPLSFVGQQLVGINCAHLWYLPCLFLLMIICYPLFLWASRNLWKHAIIFCGFLALNYFSGRLPNYFQLQQVGYYLVFFHIGYLVNFIRQIYPEQIKKYSLWSVYLLLIVLLIVFGFILSKVTSIGFEIYLSFIVIIALYKLMPSFNNIFINEISKRSYGLYLFHSPFIYITAKICPNINPWLMLTLNFICFGCIAYGITYLLSKSRLKFVIGE